MPDSLRETTEGNRWIKMIFISLTVSLLSFGSLMLLYVSLRRVVSDLVGVDHRLDDRLSVLEIEFELDEKNSEIDLTHKMMQDYREMRKRES